MDNFYSILSCSHLSVPLKYPLSIASIFSISSFVISKSKTSAFDFILSSEIDFGIVIKPLCNAHLTQI